jgi:choice-of-anchor C domain-containing protein
MRRIFSALFAFAWAASAFAAPFQNGGFETGTLSADPCNGAIPVGGGAITGWTVILGDIDYVTPACWTPSEGSRSLDLVGTGSVGGIEQTFDTVPGQTYRVTFDLAGNPSTLFPPATKNLVVAVDGAPHSYTFDTTGHSTTSMGWTTQSFVFVANGSSSTLSFASDMTPSTFAGAALDNVRVQAIAAVDAWTGSGGQVYSGQAVAYPAVPMICSGPGTNWNEFGGGPFSYPPAVTSDGTLGPVVASYNVPQGNTVDGICGSWTASATAATARDVSVAWNYSGFHAFFDVTADLKAFVVRAGSIVQSDYLVAVANPDDQFTFSGPYTFHLQAGDVYGFTMTGSNFDSTDAMSGTLYLTGTLATSLNPQSSANPAPLGSTVTFTGTVTGSSPRGSAAFSDAGTPIGGCEAVALVPIDATHSSASCSVSSLSPGAHAIGVAYSGDMANARSSNTVTQTMGTTLATPVVIRALPAGSFSLPLIGRVDGASSLPITVRLYAGTTCIDGVLGGTVAPIGADTPVTTDPSGYFGTVQGGSQGQFVAIGVTTPQLTALSACVVTSADNDTWPKALRLTGDSPSVSDWIDAAGKARWYKFSVIPGQSIQVTMSNLPADYDLAVFKDIGSEFLGELVPVNAAQLTKLSAEFAPSAFSPSAFSPSAFSPSAFSPSAFSPSAFSPSAFSPSAFSPSAFSPSAFSPSAFSPSAFSPSAFSPSAFSPSAFSPSAFSPSAFSPSAFSTVELEQAFSSAQTRSIIATSMTPGTGNESVAVETWNSTGDFYVRVTGRAGASSPAAYSLAVAKQGTSCSAVTDTTISTRTAAGSGYSTIVLVDSSKTALSAPVAGGSLGSKLAAFVQRPEVHGVLVDVASDIRVSALKAQASANASCPFAKNLVASEIKSIVDAYLMTNPLRYVVIVGNDDAIPFFRYPDQSLLGEESGYVPPVSSASASEASLRGNFVLGQDGYGATTHISLGVVDFPIMGLAVGRLVETPAEIAGMIDAYVAVDGSVSPGSSLVTGYDFLQDDADAVRAELEAGTGRPGDALITANTVSPADTRSYASGGPWTASDLRQKLLGTRHDVVFLAGHFNANSALAADFTTSIVTSELAASDVFTNAVVFSAGCHSGYNLVDTDAINGVTFPLDWAQAFAQRKATLIAGTGYQYGDTDFLEYSERLYLNFAKELRAGTGAVAVGEALVKAKLAYLATTPDLRGLHEKALLEATLFGLPMLGVNMPSGRTTPPVVGTLSPVAVDGGPAGTLGLRIAEVSLAPVLTAHTQVLNNFEVQPPTTTTATWLNGPDGVVTHPVEPALPLALVNATPDDPALVLRGVGFRGATYDDSTVLPLTGAPTTELRGVHVPFSSPVFFPMRLWSANYFGALSGGGGGTNLLVTPAQHRTPDAASGTSTLRQYSSLDLELFYSGLVACDKTAPPSCNGSTGDPAFAAAALSDAPTIERVDAVPNGGLTTFSAQVVGDPAAAMHAVWVTYTSGAGGHGTWTSVDLQQCVAPLPAACGLTADSQYWKAAVTTASLPSDGKYIVQAVNGVGLVSLDDNLGRYYAIAPTAPTATAIGLDAPVATSAAYGDTRSITATLSAGSSPVAGKPVTIAVGGTARAATTDATGRASVQLPILAAPGAYPVTASFAGDDAFLSSSMSAPTLLMVSKAVTTLAPLAGRVGAVLTASIGGKAQPLIQRSVQFWISGPGGVQQVFAITDYNGFAAIPPPGSPAGTYSVMQACFAGDATYLGATLNASMTCGYRFAGFFQPVDNVPISNSMKAGQSVPVKFSLGGNRGLGILASNSPASQAVNCNGFSGLSIVDQTGTAGSSSLQYDAIADQYTYVWKTDKAWVGTCRVLLLTLNDGSQYRANFQFK